MYALTINVYLILCINIGWLVHWTSNSAYCHQLIGLFVQILPLPLSKCQHLYRIYSIHRLLGRLSPWSSIYLSCQLQDQTKLTVTPKISWHVLQLRKSIRHSCVTMKFHLNNNGFRMRLGGLHASSAKINIFSCEQHNSMWRKDFYMQSPKLTAREKSLAKENKNTNNMFRRDLIVPKP